MTYLTISLALLLCSCFVAVTANGRNSTKLCPAVAKCIGRLDRGLDCKVLPVPARSRLIPIPNGLPVELRKLREGVWFHRDSSHNSLMLRHKRRLVLVDMPDSDGNRKSGGSGTRLTDSMEKIMDGVSPHRIDLVYTHAHFDHIGASTRIVQWISRVYPKARVNIYGGTDVKELIEQSVSKRAVPPTRLIHNSGSIVLRKGLRINMKVLSGHTNDDIAIHIPRHGSEPGILFFVDVVFPRWAPFALLAITENVAKYIEVHSELMKFKFDMFVDGHLDIGTKADITENLRFTRDLISATQEASRSVTDQDRIDAGIANFVTPGTPEFGNLWFAAITADRELVARKCARIMIEKWGCRLGGVAVSIGTHCLTAGFYTTVRF